MLLLLLLHVVALDGDSVKLLLSGSSYWRNEQAAASSPRKLVVVYIGTGTLAREPIYLVLRVADEVLGRMNDVRVHIPVLLHEERLEHRRCGSAVFKKSW